MVLCCAQDRLCSFLSSGGRTCPPALLSLPCAHPPAGLSCCCSAQSHWDRDWEGSAKVETLSTCQGMPGEYMSPSAWDSLLPLFHRTRNKNCSRTSLGHFSFPICFSTFLSLSRSSCSPSPAVSTGTGWKQGSNRSDRVNHLLMSSVPGVDGKALPCRELPWAGGNLSLGELDLPLLRWYVLDLLRSFL